MTRSVQLLATVFFAVAILHTFAAGKIGKLSKTAEKGSIRSNLYRVLGEVEIVFGLWAAVWIALFAAIEGPDRAIRYVDGVDFTEAAFVFAIMAVSATRPIRDLAYRGIELVSKSIVRIAPRVSAPQAFFFVTLVVGPLLGSFITEPAAMTVCALILKDRFFRYRTTERFRYKTLGLLFVNVSIGGVLTSFAAPPVVMVAKTWGWDTLFMLSHFGIRAAIAVIANSAIALYFLRNEFSGFEKSPAAERKPARTPPWITIVHLGFLFLVVYSSHHLSVFLGIFLLFVGVTSITESHQDRLQLRESMLVGFFLAGLVVLGKPQSWWLSPLLSSLSRYPLYFGATALTAITDNAALTFLGAQVPHLSESLRHALVAGAVTGGGLTVIANAPNPAGYGLLKEHFGEKGIRPGRLFLSALVPTAIAAFFLEVL